MKIEEGKFYKMRCGGVVGPMEMRGDAFYHADMVWTNKGACYGRSERYIFDLIEEVPDPSITNALAQKWREMHQPDHFPGVRKMVFDRDAFRRETAAKVLAGLMDWQSRNNIPWHEIARDAVDAADALLQELGE